MPNDRFGQITKNILKKISKIFHHCKLRIIPTNILILNREYITNFGDPIIGDCCKYLIEKVAKKEKYKVNIKIFDIYNDNKHKPKKRIKKASRIVFPGGGLNSVKFNNRIIQLLEICNKYNTKKLFFNAIGILKVDPNPENEKLLTNLLNNKQVLQVTTRGDFSQLKKYITRQHKYQQEWFFDPAMWVNEAYNIEKQQDSNLIGIGIIRAEIFEKNKKNFSQEDVKNMYLKIFKELDKRNLEWEIFTNGYNEDYNFAIELMKEYKIDTTKIKHPTNRYELVKNISTYKGIIAARLHANIIATSLQIPSIGLVWNDKMNCFAQMIGYEDRYLNIENLHNEELIINKLEKAMNEGYNNEKINKYKDITLKTIKNIIES